MEKSDFVHVYVCVCAGLPALRCVPVFHYSGNRACFVKKGTDLI